MRTLALVILLLTGCSVDEDDFPYAYADAICDQQRRCDRGAYEENYTSNDECEAAQIDFVDGWEDLQSLFGNDYDVELGTECVREIRSEDCVSFEDGDYLDVCADVWH